MSLLKELLNKTEKIDFLFPNSFEELMNNDYYDYDKFEWFLYYVFKLEGSTVDKIGKKGKGDGGADLILTIPQNDGGVRRIGVQAKYWKNRVGTEPINQLASAKSRHKLTDLWIITTSDLTSDAKEIAESMDIKVLRAEDVAKMISAVKEKYQNDIEKNKESSITFIETKKEVKVIKEKVATTQTIDNEDPHVEGLKLLRLELSKKYNLVPIYNVFNNETIASIIEIKPITLELLSKVKGLGEKKIETFGKEILEYVQKNLIIETQDIEAKLKELLLEERPKIAKYNKLKEEDVYSDKVAGFISKMKPTSKEVLEKVYGFKKENITIFGDYLIKLISKFLSDNKK